VSTIAPTGVSGLLIHLAPLVAAFVFACWWAIRKAPEGYEDRDGFHYGPEVNSVDWEEFDRMDWDFHVWDHRHPHRPEDRRARVRAATNRVKTYAPIDHEDYR
jgi:hypothetical protein